MKRYIKYSSAITVDVDTSKFVGTPFKCDTTTSYYNDFLNKQDLAYMQEHKNRTGTIQMMSPKEYIDACANHIFGGRVTSKELMEQRYASKTEEGTSLIDSYVDAMQSGAKFPLCYLNYAAHQQEGLHRMMAAGTLYGWDMKFPVLVVDVFDYDIEQENKLVAEYHRFRDYAFYDICQAAADDISSWRSPVPDNFTELYKNSIIDMAKTYDEDTPYDIDVDVNIIDMDTDPVVQVNVTRYGSYVLDGYDAPYQIALDDMYDVYGKHNTDSNSYKGIPDDELDALLDDIDLDDIDLSDSGISKLFFRE